MIGSPPSPVDRPPNYSHQPGIRAPEEGDQPAPFVPAKPGNTPWPDAGPTPSDTPAFGGPNYDPFHGPEWENQFMREPTLVPVRGEGEPVGRG